MSINNPNNKLKFLRPLMQTTTDLLKEYFEKTRLIPDLALPSASKEISLSPLLFHAARVAYDGQKREYLPAAEIPIKRYNGTISGRLDLGLFSEKRIVMIECKCRRPKLFSFKKSPVNYLQNALYAAEEQLRNADPSNLMFTNSDGEVRDNRKITKVALVTLNILIPETRLEENLELRFEEFVANVRGKNGQENRFVDCMTASVYYGPHSVNVPANYYSIGQIFVAREVIDLT